MGLISQSQSQRESYPKRDERVEQAAQREMERTVSEAEEHREAVAGDAHAEGRPQRVAARHQGGVVDSLTRSMPEQEAPKSGAKRAGGKRNEGGERAE